jgi:uncharacterized protein
MSALPTFSAVVLRLGETVAVAVAGGALATRLGVPAGWLSGSMLFVALAAICGRPMLVPMPLQRVFFVLMGILLGGVVTPETLHGILTWPFSIAVLAISTLCMIVASSSYLRHVHGWDRVSAVFGASPGSMAQVMLLSTEYRADVRAIAVVQTVRGLLLTAGLPLGLALFGLAEPSTTLTRGGAASNTVTELTVLFAVSIAAGLAMFWLRLPGGLLFGTMLGSAVLHGGGFVHATLPEWLAIAGVMGVGALTGARFAGTSPRLIVAYLGAALGSFAVVVSIASVFCLLVARVLSVRIADAVIAFAPGAQDTMMVLALAMHLDPVFVGAHHLARFVVVSIAVPLLVQRIAGPRPKPGERIEPPRLPRVGE